MDIRVELRGRDIAPYLKRRLFEVLEEARWFIEIGFDSEVRNIVHHASIILSMLEGDKVIRDASEAESVFDSLSVLLDEFHDALEYEIVDEDLSEILSKAEELMEEGKAFAMNSWLLEKAASLWEDSNTLVETLWVGGMLYGEEISSRVSALLSASSGIAHILGVMETVEPAYGLDYSSYFIAKYGVYYLVYEKAGCSSSFAIPGQKRLNALAREIHKREKFFDEMLKKYENLDYQNITLSEFGKLVRDFPGVDRRIEILRQLSNEGELTCHSFSTFDPRRTMDFLIKEIKSDYYGGAYVPAGEDEISYECVITGLRAKWLEKNSI